MFSLILARRSSKCVGLRGQRYRALFVVFLMSNSASRGSSAPAPVTLESLRSRIDSIDAEIHALLMERAQTVTDIVAAKGPTPSAVVIQPAREGTVLQRRLEAHHGPLPPAIITHIWRCVISAFCDLQRTFRVHVVGLSGADGGMRDLARFWFGFVPALAEPADAAVAVRVLQRAESDLGLVPLSASGPWWRGLAADGVHVVARFARPSGETADCLLIAGAKVGPAAGSANVFAVSWHGPATPPALDDADYLATARDGTDAFALVATPASADVLLDQWRRAGDVPLPALAAVGQYDPELVAAASFGAMTSHKEPKS